MAGERTPSHAPFLRRPWTRGRIGGRTVKGGLWLAIALLACLLLFGETGWVNQARLEARRVALERELESLRYDAARLEAERARLADDPAYRERVAREEWGFKKDGETVYQLRRLD
jgi:cell division protein FtsB